MGSKTGSNARRETKYSRSTQKEFDLVSTLLLCRQILLDHFLGNESLFASPHETGFVESVDDLETVRVFFGELIPVFTEHWKKRIRSEGRVTRVSVRRGGDRRDKERLSAALLTDIFLGNISINQSPLCLVLRQSHRMRNHLIHRSNTRSTTDANTVLKLIGLVAVNLREAGSQQRSNTVRRRGIEDHLHIFLNRPFECESVSWLELSDVLRHLAILYRASRMQSRHRQRWSPC